MILLLLYECNLSSLDIKCGRDTHIIHVLAVKKILNFLHSQAAGAQKFRLQFNLSRGLYFLKIAKFSGFLHNTNL